MSHSLQFSTLVFCLFLKFIYQMRSLYIRSLMQQRSSLWPVKKIFHPIIIYIPTGIGNMVQRVMLMQKTHRESKAFSVFTRFWLWQRAFNVDQQFLMCVYSQRKNIHLLSLFCSRARAHTFCISFWVNFLRLGSRIFVRFDFVLAFLTWATSLSTFSLRRFYKL